MKSIQSPDWQQRRSELNHQWLKNRLLSALDSAANLLGGRIKGVGYVQDVLDEEVREWQERRNELNILIDRFEAEMSPRKVFAASPLAEWEPEVKEIMSNLLHELWLVRNPVREWVGNARSATQAVETSYVQLVQSEPVGEDGRIGPEFCKHFEAFRSACRALAKTIEQFPNNILLT
jgi:hypothetical protein